MKTFFRVGSRLINTAPGSITDVDLYAPDPNHPDTPGVRINWGVEYAVTLSGQDAKEFRGGCEALVLADIGSLKTMAAGSGPGSH
jgi:hypothetical protein